MKYILPFLFVLSRASQEFHSHLNREELLHYFGTSHINKVPSYEFVSPTSVQNAPHQRNIDLSKEYLLSAFGNEYHLYLLPYSNLISSACIIQRIKSNHTHSLEPCVQKEELCHYHGYLKNHSQSSAAVSTCDGLHGVISLPDHDLVIQPVRSQHLNLTVFTSPPHIVYKRSVTQSFNSLDTPDSVTHYRRKRRRRSAGQYLEIKAVVAPDSAKFHGTDTRRFVTTVLNVAAKRFLDNSLGYRLYLTLVDILIIEDNQEGLNIVSDSGTLLDNFCQWQQQFHPADESNPRHADHVLLITKVDLENHGDDSNVGLAYKGKMCSRRNQCSINEDTGLDLGLTITHELGHSLGMNHDGQDNNCNDGPFIMAASGAGSLKWSRCSAKYLEDFMSESSSSCLNDAPAGSATNLQNIKEKPGMYYSATKQCQLAMDTEDTYYCNGQVDCGSLKCHRGSHCYLLNTPLVDGTECGNRKWCIEGKCVAMGAGSPSPIHGGWSSWSHQWTGCSRTCGGGVKLKTRKCNNPEPRFGGRQCQGEEITAMLCNVQPCSTSQYRLKEEQCTATNNQPYNGHRYHWIPYASSSGIHACQLLCRYPGGNTAVPRGNKIYLDGTECQGHSDIARCVDGKCEEFGCDGHHGSGLRFDKCGVCNGRGNTCHEHRGTYDKGTANKYVTFVTIPRGSTGIVITNLNQFCHLSVRVNGKRLFSEDGNAVSNSGTYSSHNVVAKYRRQGPEKIEITGPLPVSIEAQVWRDYGPEYMGTSPDVTYYYYTPSSNPYSTYKWVKTPGGCSHTCGQGVSVPIVNCVHVSNNRQVDDFHCNLNTKPSESIESCNDNPCPPSWNPGKWEACSRTCGGGQTHRTAQCMVLQHGSLVPLAESHCRGQQKPLTSKSCNVNPCPAVWKGGDWSCCSKTCSKGVKTRQVKCYSSRDSNQPIADSKCLANQKPATQEICMDKPCDTSLKGSSCKDKLTDCVDYGINVCYSSEYESWAKGNCKEYCGHCLKDPDSFRPRPSDNCKDKVNCAEYGANVCNDYADWSKENCQRTCNHCPVTTCTNNQAQTTDQNNEHKSSGTCTDKVSDCADYGANMCSEYGEWAKENCEKHCHLCQEKKDEVPSSGSCTDAVTDCADYGANVCTEYGDWAKKNCQKHCNLCQGAIAMVTTTQPATTGTCKDIIDDCADYGANVCTEYGDWAKKNCQKHCQYCKDDCKDKLSDCADYGKSACKEYGDWANENCQNFCNLCGSRKKRSLPFWLEEPMQVPKKKSHLAYNPNQDSEDYHLGNSRNEEITRSTSQGIHKLDMEISNEDNKLEKVPTKIVDRDPVANHGNQTGEITKIDSKSGEYANIGIVEEEDETKIAFNNFRRSDVNIPQKYDIPSDVPVEFPEIKDDQLEGVDTSVVKNEPVQMSDSWEGIDTIHRKIVPSELGKISSDTYVFPHKIGTENDMKKPSQELHAKDQSISMDESSKVPDNLSESQTNVLNNKSVSHVEVAQKPNSPYSDKNQAVVKPLVISEAVPKPVVELDKPVVMLPVEETTVKSKPNVENGKFTTVKNNILRHAGGHHWVEISDTDDAPIQIDSDLDMEEIQLENEVASPIESDLDIDGNNPEKELALPVDSDVNQLDKELETLTEDE